MIVFLYRNDFLFYVIKYKYEIISVIQNKIFIYQIIHCFSSFQFKLILILFIHYLYFYKYSEINSVKTSKLN